MKKIFVFLVIYVFGVSSFAQNTDYLRFLPSNMNPNEVRPSDIPSEQVLQQMGFSSEEISEAMDFKYSKGKYASDESDTSLIDNKARIDDNVQKFYKNMEGKTPNDKVKFPKAKIYGQDIFRTNDFSFFQQSTSENPPSNYEIGPSDQFSIAV